MKSNVASWRLIAGIAVLLLADWRLMPTLWTATPRNDSFNGFLFFLTHGLVLGQHALLAGYLAAGAGPWLRRSAVVTILAVAIWYLRAEAAIATGESFELDTLPRTLWFVDAASLVPTCLCVGFVQFVRRRFMNRPDAVVTRSQFSIRDLFFLTIAAALLSAIASSSNAREIWATEMWTRSYGRFFATLAGVNLLFGGGELLVSLLGAWLLFGRAPWRRRLIVSLALVATGIALAAVAVQFKWLPVDALNTLAVMQCGIWCAYAVGAATLRTAWENSGLRADPP